MSNLKSKTVKGGFFLTVTNILNQVIAIVLNIILARLLLAEDFGLIALSTTYVGFITLFVSIGFGSAIIHFNEATKSHISTLYYLNFIIAAVTFLIVFFTASFAANFYGDKELEYIVKWSSLSILITPFFITHLKIFERDLQFKTIGIIIVISSILSAIFSIISVFNGLGVYALVVQALSLTCFKLIFVLYLSKWKPNNSFRVKEVKHMIWYAIKYRMSQGALYFERNIDYLLLGKIFTSTVLGYYAFSYNIMYTPVKRISNIFKDVLFSSFSKFKNDKEKILLGYFKSLQIVAFISFPGMLLIALNAEWLILTVFGEQWKGAIPIVEILCIAGALQSISQFGDVVFDSTGKPEISLYIAIFRTVLTVLSIIIGSFYGVLTIAYLLTVSKALSFAVILFTVKHQINFKLYTLWKYVQGTIFCIVIVLLSQIIYNGFLGIEFNGLLKLLIQSIITGICIFVFYKSVLVDLYKTIKVKSVN